MSNRFIIEDTPLAGLQMVTRLPIGDTRGFLERVFCETDLHVWGQRPIAQINRTLTAEKATLRGLHFQRPPHAECKYVTCLQGAVFDVALDLRIGSKTYGKWFGCELRADLHNALIIPEGFAHGFQTLEDNVQMLYLHSASYAAGSEGGVSATDPAINITWPMPIGLQSARDAALPHLENLDGITL